MDDIFYLPFSRIKKRFNKMSATQTSFCRGYSQCERYDRVLVYQAYLYVNKMLHMKLI